MNYIDYTKVDKIKYPQAEIPKDTEWKEPVQVADMKGERAIKAWMSKDNKYISFLIMRKLDDDNISECKFSITVDAFEQMNKMKNDLIG